MCCCTSSKDNFFSGDSEAIKQLDNECFLYHSCCAGHAILAKQRPTDRSIKFQYLSNYFHECVAILAVFIFYVPTVELHRAMQLFKLWFDFSATQWTESEKVRSCPTR